MSELLRPQEIGIPVPQIGTHSAPLWEAAQRGVVAFQRCEQCGASPHKVAVVCGRCHARNLAWVESAGRGRLYSWTVVWRPQTPAFHVPYAPAIVQMDEGFWLICSLIGLAPDDIKADLEVGIEFHAASEALQIPYARPLPR